MSTRIYLTAWAVFIVFQIMRNSLKVPYSNGIVFWILVLTFSIGYAGRATWNEHKIKQAQEHQEAETRL